MEKSTLKKEIRNYRDGHHLNSKYWQEWKKNISALPPKLREIAIGMIISDACMYKKSTEALIKFEQGYLQKEFLYHLFDIFKLYCFMVEPGKRIDNKEFRKGSIKSYWFKTFSHSSFTDLFTLFYSDIEGKIVKKIQEGIILNNLTSLGLAAPPLLNYGRWFITKRQKNNDITYSKFYWLRPGSAKN
jgi:LAGLIDADG DNA endonuclease family